MVIVGVKYVCYNGKEVVFSGKCAEIALCGQWARFDETDSGAPITVEKKTKLTLMPVLDDIDIITSALYKHANGLAMSCDGSILMDIDVSTDASGRWNVSAIQPSSEPCTKITSFNDIDTTTQLHVQVGFCVCWLVAQGE